MKKKSTFLEACPPQARIGDLARGIFQQIGENPAREGLIRTPERFERALLELTKGYSLSPEQVVGEGIFASESDGLVAVRNIEFFSLCEHHMLPFWGRASIAYYPNGKILGLSKLARILEVYARRLQVQERLTHEVAIAIRDLIGARAVAITIDAQHMCMMMRGVRKQSSSTRTEYLVGGDSLLPREESRLWKQIQH